MSGVLLIDLVLGRLPLMLAYLAGVIVSIILVRRRGDMPAWLALVGFAILLLTNLFGIALNLLVAVGTMGLGFMGLIGLVGNIAALAGMVCIIIALWQGMQR